MDYTTLGEIWQYFRRPAILGFLGGILVIQLVGLLGQMKDPDLPSFNSIHTDLLNPWSSWCSWNNGQITACYGTSWNHFGGPYSIMWYWAMILVGLDGRISFTMGLFAVNTFLLGLVASRKSFLLLPYGFTSLIFLLAWPQNMVILFLLLAGFWTRWSTVLAFLFKLPIGFWGLAVWRFFLTNPDSLHAWINWPVYGILIAWGCATLVYDASKKSHKKPSLSTTAVADDVVEISDKSQKYSNHH